MVLLILFNNFNVFVNTKNKNKNSFNIFLILIYLVNIIFVKDCKLDQCSSRLMNFFIIINERLWGQQRRCL
jgi:hypothetical protein